MMKCARESTSLESSRHPARAVSPIALAIALALAVNLAAQPVAAATHPIEGWPMAKWGMTEPEVLKAFGTPAKILAEGSSAETDLRAAIGIDDVGVGGVPFRALFLLDQTDKLEKIRLYGPAPSIPPDDQFKAVEGYLGGKYSEPLSGTIGDSARSVWILKNSVIELDYLPMTVLDLHFERRDGQTKESVLDGFVEIQHKQKREIRQASAAPLNKSLVLVGPAIAAKPGKWGINKSKSQFDDSPTVVLALQAENSINGWLVTSTPALIIRCQERRTEVYVVTGMPASVESGGTNLHTVRLRFGDSAAYTTVMAQSSDNKSLFFSDPINDIIRMWNVQSLLVGFTPFNANPVTIRFDVSGLPFAIQPLRDACVW